MAVEAEARWEVGLRRVGEGSEDDLAADVFGPPDMQEEER